MIKPYCYHRPTTNDVSLNGEIQVTTKTVTVLYLLMERYRFNFRKEHLKKKGMWWFKVALISIQTLPEKIPN